MKIMAIVDKGRFFKFAPESPVKDKVEFVFFDRDASKEELLEKAGDAEMVVVDAITPFSAEVMKEMKNLKVVHSEGVAFNGIDVKGAAELGIYVCNNKGGNATSVAEQAIMLMMACLRDEVRGHKAVVEGRQIEMKERMMRDGMTDLGDCTVGLVGFGDIAKATAVRLKAFGCKLYYYSAHRKSPEIEKQYDVEYLPLYELAEKCNIVSLHAAVNETSKGMIDDEFISHMREDGWIINTARGELVNNDDLRKALVLGRIAGAGFDTIAPEPVMKDNPLVALPKDTKATVIYAPHLGGNTTGSFLRIYKHLWENIERVYNGEKPDNIVNGVE